MPVDDNRPRRRRRRRRRDEDEPSRRSPSDGPRGPDRGPGPPVDRPERPRRETPGPVHTPEPTPTPERPRRETPGPVHTPEPTPERPRRETPGPVPEPAPEPAPTPEPAPGRDLERVPLDDIGRVDPRHRVGDRDHTESFAELKASHPLLLMPVRLETRFDEKLLRIRIYPDQVHLNEHEARLTAEEERQGRQFWRRWRGGDDADRRTAEQWITERIPARRAAYVARKTEPQVRDGKLVFEDLENLTDASPATATCLPDRWAAVGFIRGQQTFVEFGNPVPADLPIAPRLEDAGPWSDEDGALPVDEGVAWMVDYGEAVDVGMGITVELETMDYQALEHFGLTLLVVGIRGDGPNDGRKELERLLRRHLYSDGLEFVPQGTPTNNTDEGIAGWTRALDDVPGFFARELEDAGVVDPTDRDADAARLTTALGLRDRSLLGRVVRGDQDEEAGMRAMNRALWPVTWGRYFDDLLAPVAEEGERESAQVSVLPGEAIDAARDFFVDHVRGGAPLPALSIGCQPYGILPVRRTREGHGLSCAWDNLEWVLLDLKERWRSSLEEVPRLDPVIGDRIGGDPKDDAVTILGSLPHPGRFVVRRLQYDRAALEGTLESLIGTQEALAVETGLLGLHDAYYMEIRDVDSLEEQLALIDELNERVPDLVVDPSLHADARMRLLVVKFLALIHENRQRPLDRLASTWINGAWATDRGGSAAPTNDDPKLFWSQFSSEVDDREWNRPLVQAANPGDGATAAEYLRGLASRIGFERTGPVELDHAVTRTSGPASLTRRSPAARDLSSARAAAPGGGRQPEGISPAPAPDPSDAVPANRPLLYQLLDALDLPSDLPLAQRGPTRSALRDLASLAERDIDQLELRLRETLGLASHRLDAWFTGLARKRLDAIRNAASEEPKTGIQLGGFGWVLDLFPDDNTDTTSLGYTESKRESQGFIHAPSLGHAATAAVLRAGWNAHGTDEPDSLIAVNLRSDRVRLAAWLLDGVRQGQALGDLLGCRFERARHDSTAGVDDYIDDCRRAVLAARGDNRGPRGPVDGLELAALFEGDGVVVEDGAYAMRSDNRPGGARRKAVWAALDDILRAMDAVADASITDSVHHLLQGNSARASATLDAISTGAVPPPELRSIATPRPGAGVTQRLLITLGSEALSGSSWSAGGHRATLEPALESWVARVVGEPSAVVCQVTVDGLSDEPLRVTFADLGASALDAVFESPAGSPDGDSEWSRRVTAFVLGQESYRGSEGRLLIDFDASPDDGEVSFAEFAQLARAVRSLLAGARPLDARDLDLPGSEAEPGRKVRQAEGRVKTFRRAFVGAVKQLEQVLPEATEEDPHPVGDRVRPVRQAMANLQGTGLRGATPTTGYVKSGAPQLYADAWALAEAGRARVDAFQLLRAAWAAADEENPPAPEIRWRRAVETLRTLMGADFPLLPQVVLADGAPAAAAFAASDALLEGEPAKATAWLRKVARVRGDVAKLEEVLTLSELIRDDATLGPVVGQLPDQDVWVSTRAPADRTRGYLGMCALDHGGIEALGEGRPVSGLVVDTWVERIPADDVVTGVAVHFDAPSSRPPQSLLLMVPPEGEPWSFDLVLDTLLETLEAAQLRSVDPDALSAYGHQFPAIYPPGRLQAGAQE